MALRCIKFQNSPSLSRHVLCMEFAQKSTGICVYGYQPPLFPLLEGEVSDPSSHALLYCWQMTILSHQINLLNHDHQTELLKGLGEFVD